MFCQLEICLLLSTNKMTRNKVNKNWKMTREEMMEVSVQHMVHARLLWNHLVAAEEKIKRLEKEKDWPVFPAHFHVSTKMKL